MKNWKTVKLGEVLKRQYDSVEINDNDKYKRLTIKTKGQGISLRNELQGVDIGTKNQFRVKSNQFLLSKIDAMNGAFGIIPIECDNGIITGNFWTYNFDETILNRDYLNFLCIGEIFTDFSIKASEGTTNRKYLREDKFLNLDFHLPPLAEQQRIVARLSALKNKIDEVKILRGEQEKEMQRMKSSIATYFQKNDEIQRLGDVLIKSTNYIQPQIGTSYRQVGVRWWGEGAYERETIDGGQTSYLSFCLLEKGDFIFNKIWVRNGALAIVKEDTIGCYAPNEFPIYKCKENILPKWLEFTVTSVIFWEKCANLSQGTSGKNRIKPEQLLGIEVWIPPLVEQQRIIDILDKISAMKQYQTEQMTLLNGIFPSLLNKAFRGEL